VLFGRVSRIVFDIVGTFVVLLLLAAGILSWRLSAGPLSLDFLTPLIVRALSDENASVTVKDTVLEWGGWQHNFDIRIRDVRMMTRDGLPLLEVPEVSVDLSPRALLLHGLIAPTSLDAFGVQLTLVRSADGTWHFRGPGSGGTGGEAPSGMPVIFDELLAPPNPDRSLGYLLSVSILNSSVTLIDERSGHTFMARDTRFLVRRDHVGLRAELSAAVDLAGKPATVSAIGHYVSASKALDLGLNFAKLDPIALSAAAPELGALSGLDVPLSGRVDLQFDPQFQVAQAAFKIAGESGRLVAAPYGLPADTPVRRLRLEGRMPSPAAVEITNAEVDLGGPVIGLRGGVTGLDAQPHAAATVTARNVSADDLRRLWPRNLASHARDWITENIIRANIGEARAEISAGAQAVDAHWTVDQANGTFTATDVEANYLTPMPHVAGVNGEGTFTKSRVDITTNGGGVGDLRLGTASIALTALDTNDETADLDVPINGPVRDALELVDGPPLGYVKKIDRKPSDFSGDMALRLQLKLPLKHDLKTDQIDVLATARVQNLTQHDAALGQDVTDGDVQLRVDRNALQLTGKVKLGPVPADIDMTRNFAAAAPIIGRTRAAARVASAADFTALGFDAAPYIDGPTNLTADYVERQGGRSDVTVDATLDDAAVSIDQLDWHKAAGQPAAAHMVVDVAGGRTIDVTNVSVSSGDPAAGGLLARGQASFAPDGRTLATVKIDTLKVGVTDVHGAVTRSDAGLSVQVAGAGFNLEPLLKGDTAPAGPNRPPLSLDVQVDRLYFEPDHWLSRVRFVGRRGADRWLTADLQADTSDEPKANSHASLALQMFANGRQTLDMVAEDAGGFFRADGITPNVVGGRLVIHGATDPARAGQPIVGHLNMSAYRVVRAPILARVLSVALLTGVLDSLRGEGVGFSQLDADFAYYGPKVEVTDAHSAGAAIGVTANGSLDLEGDTIDLSGTIVPANALNSLPAKIPLIGNLLTGGGGGLFAATYKVSGPLSDPKVSVNALSTLAPGFLRNLFGGLGGKSATDAAPESEKQIQRDQPKEAKPTDPPATPPGAKPP
jgi:hypothetical protein